MFLSKRVCEKLFILKVQELQVTTGSTGGYSHLTPIGVGTGKLFHDHSLVLLCQILIFLNVTK